ncbi:MAG: hypothetical protein ABI162_00010 [Luteolibacter sp.]
MTPRVSTTWLNTSSDNDFEATTHSIITALTGSTLFADPKPTLAEISTHLSAFTSASSAARNGGKVETAAKNASWISPTTGSSARTLNSARSPRSKAWPFSMIRMTCGLPPPHGSAVRPF